MFILDLQLNLIQNVYRHTNLYLIVTNKIQFKYTEKRERGKK